MSQPPPSVLDAAQALTGAPAVQVRDDGVWFVATGHDAADALARELRGNHRELGWWPLLVEDLDVEQIWSATFGEVPTGSEAVAGVSDEDLEELLFPYADGQALPDSVDARPAEPGPIDYVGEGEEWVGLLLVPAVRPWEALPFVGFGGYNDCPLPVEHGAVARWLYDEHGSDPIAVSPDYVIFRSLRPVAPDVLAETVRILMSYCSEIAASEADPDELAGLLAAGVSRLGLWWD